VGEHGLDLKAANVVVTGGGNGIGRALARRAAAEGARVVVNDLDAAAAEEVAAEVEGLAVAGDVSNAEGTGRLVSAARAEFGEIDLFCANAGVAPPGGVEVADEAWAHAWDLNVMAHVHAARELLPAWLERGRGHLLVTVSAAGLLTMLGAAAYSATKHAALAFAEWLSISYADRGITVQALCPQGVRTAMLDQSGAAASLLLQDGAIEPDQVADAAVDGLRDGGFLILPHPEVGRYYAARANDPDRWLAGMRKLQRRIDENQS
jgi:NAD(P)-dependent dehydrogenase (short-subunit alcohol dehydrogenase family)